MGTSHFFELSVNIHGTEAADANTIKNRRRDRDPTLEQPRES